MKNALLGIVAVLQVVSPFLIARNNFKPSNYCQTCRTPAILLAKSDSGACLWSPQDLTKDNQGYLPIPENDYIKQYQRNPDSLWPVEFFLITYRRNAKNKKTHLLVRKSANGTAKYGVGTGVPVTRWLLSTQNLPRGYEFREPPIEFDARNFPEFPESEESSWTYRKIDICRDAFDVAGDNNFHDPELKAYATKIWECLKEKLSAQRKDDIEKLETWEAKRLEIIQKIIEKDNSITAIQGMLRMSGIFERTGRNGSGSPRYIALGELAPDPVQLVQSMQIYTMFPQMPDPMPMPSATSEELKEEIQSRVVRMKMSGRDPHKDVYGRKYTHISTSNVSNTIHGIYFTLDATDIPGLDQIPALDLFSTEFFTREWKNLEELKVLDPNAKDFICTEDPKSTFISGYIVRQLIKDGKIDIHRTD